MEDKKEIASVDIKKSIEDAQLVAAYISRKGHIDIDRKLLETIVKAKYKCQNGEWTDEVEVDFLLALDKITKMLSPVSIKSLKATMPIELMEKKKGFFKASRADINVMWYSGLTLIALLLLMFLQGYSLIGNNLNANINEFFNKRQEIRVKIEDYQEIKGEGLDLKKDMKFQELTQREKVVNEKMDANYELLKRWNSVWQRFVPNGDFSNVKSPLYVEYKHKDTIERLNKSYDKELAKNKKSQNKIDKIETMIKDEKLKDTYYKARLIMFVHEISSEFVLSALSIFVLPLLYGYLGAAAFVLRSLFKEIKDLTFSSDSTIRFRLRIALGALAGVAIGWFFKPEEIMEVQVISNYALAFLVGYNVEVLFSLMDNMVKSISKWSQKTYSEDEKV